MHYVYIYYHPVTELPFYIGKGSGDRYKKHLTETKENTENYKKWAYIQGLRNKGLEPVIEKVFITDNEDLAYSEEARLILHYGRQGIDDNGILTNICIDNRPPRHTGPKSEETKRKMSLSKKGKPNGQLGLKRTEDTKRKISEANKGKPGTMTGKSHTIETKQKIANSNKERWTPDKREEVSNRMLGKQFTEEHKQRLSDSHKGQIVSEDTKQKMRNSQKLASIERSKIVSEKLKGKPWSEARRKAQIKRKTNGI